MKLVPCSNKTTDALLVTSELTTSALVLNLPTVTGQATNTLAMVTSDASTAVEITCVGKNGEHIADPKNCSMYYVCDWETPVHVSCNVGLYYDPILLLCNWSYDVQCNN